MASKWLVTAGKVLGTLAALLGVAYLVSHSTDEEGESTSDFNYGEKWLKSASDSELETEREKVRVVYSTAGRDNLSDREVNKLERLLHGFDKEMSDRAWGGRTDYGYPVRREHGWYLPNDD